MSTLSVSRSSSGGTVPHVENSIESSCLIPKWISDCWNAITDGISSLKNRVCKWFSSTSETTRKVDEVSQKALECEISVLLLQRAGLKKELLNRHRQSKNSTLNEYFDEMKSLDKSVDLVRTKTLAEQKALSKKIRKTGGEAQKLCADEQKDFIFRWQSTNDALVEAHRRQRELTNHSVGSKEGSEQDKKTVPADVGSLSRQPRSSADK